MSIRYLIDPTRQAYNRFDRALMKALNPEHSLKGECLSPLSPDNTSDAWQTFYPIFSRPLLNPRIQVFHGYIEDYKAHPLQWNILCQPTRLPDTAPYDEVWSFSAHDTQRYEELGCPANKITTFTGFSPPAEILKSSAQLPIAKEGKDMVFCSLQDLKSLDTALFDYLKTMGSAPETMLALHLDVAEPELETAEAQLIEFLETHAQALSLDLEMLNIGTFIGPLSEAAYLAALHESAALWWPGSFVQAQEAHALGKVSVGGPYAAYSARSVHSEGLRAETPDSSLGDFFEALSSRLHHLLNSVDFAAKAAAYEEASAAAQQGRKQKYSLFHSDYQPEELKARRQWHATYAREFKDCPGDVLDIGAGSGLFLEIMKDDLHHPAFGIDPDEDMVRVCTELGLQVIQGDERTLNDFQMQTLGGIHASHIIEHVDGSRAIAMVENAFRVLRPGGLLLIRTPNWRNEMVRHEGFWLDITHIRPYPLPLLKQVLQDAGFAVIKEGFETFGWNDTYILGQKPQEEGV